MSVLKSIIPVMIGNIIYALVVKLFILPTNLMSSGTTGIALLANHFLGIPVSFFILIFNVCMLILGLIVLGKKFAMTTIVSTLMYPTECL